jgi:hypothetical protein
MKDRQHALRMVCLELSLLKAFNPPLLDSDHEPRTNAEDQDIKGLFKSVDDDDTNNPPSGGRRVDRFVKRLDKSIEWDFVLSPSQLINDAFPKIRGLVDQIMNS